MRRSCFALTTGLILTATFMTACENPEAERREAVQAEIREASEAFAEATAIPVSPEDDRFETVRQQVSRIAQEMGRINDGGAGQQAAAQYLASVAHRQLAAMTMASIEDAEAERRATRLLLQAEIGAASRLAGVVEGQSQLQRRLEGLNLDDWRQQAESQLRTYSARMAELDEPIETRRAENAEDMETANQLLSRANEQRRAAREAGPAEGFGSFEQAIVLERQAGARQYDVTKREIELEYEYQPLHDLAAMRVAQLQDALSAMQEAEQSLEERRSLTDQQIRNLRDALRSMRSNIEEMLSNADATTLGAQYEEAQASLEQAASLAQRAIGGMRSSGGSAGLAAMSAARAREKLGDLHSSRAASLMGQAVVLEQLSMLGEAAGNAQRYQDQLAQIMSEAQAEMEAATAAYQAALEQLGQATGQDVQRQASMMRAAIQQRLGMEPERPTMPTGGGMTASGGPATNGSAGPGSAGASDGGFASPADAVSVLQGVSNAEPDAVRRYLASLRADSPRGRLMINVTSRGMQANQRFMDAMTEQFSKAAADDLVEQLAAMGLSSKSFENPRLADQAGDRATVQFDVPPPIGQSTVELEQVDGSWYVDADTLMPQLNDAMLQQMDAVMGPVVSATDSLTEQIRAGEFSSADEVLNAFMEMMSNMSGGMGN